MQQSAIAHLQLIAPGVGSVQQAQAHPAARHFNIRALHAVNQQRVAHKAAAARFAIFRRAEVIQPFILNNHREVIDAIVVRDRQVLADLVFHQPHARQTVVNLFSHPVRRVGLIPQRRRALADRQHRRPVGVRRHHARRAANQRARHLQTADGHRHVLRQAVAVDKLDVVSVPDADRRPHIAAIDPPDGGAGAGGKRPVGTLQRQKQRLAATRFQQRRNRQRRLLAGGMGLQRRGASAQRYAGSLNKLTPTE